MSSSELPKIDNLTGDNSEASGEATCTRNIQMSIETREQILDIASESKKMESNSASAPNTSQSSPTSLASTVDESTINRKIEEELKVGTSSSYISTPDHYDKKSRKSSQSTFDKKDKERKLDSKTKEKADKGLGVAGPSTSKEFALKTSDLPFTKEQLAEHLSLEEACGFLPYLMRTKRSDLRGMENDLDQISIDLQLALQDAKNICLKLDNAPDSVPEDVNGAVVEAQKLVYLLSSSYRIFEKLQQSGSALKELIQVYSKETGDFHSSVDTLLEYIIESIVKKCSEQGTIV